MNGSHINPSEETVHTNQERSHLGRPVSVVLGLLLVLSLVLNAYLILINNPELFQTQAPINQSMKPVEKLSADPNYRLGTDPRSEVIPRLYVFFEDRNIQTNPYPHCLLRSAACLVRVQKDEQTFVIPSSASLEVMIPDLSTGEDYYEVIRELFRLNQYIVLDDFQTTTRLDERNYIRHYSDISHPQYPILCTVKMMYTTYFSAQEIESIEDDSVELSITCADWDEKAQAYVDLHQEIRADLNLDSFELGQYTDQSAFISYDRGTCAIIAKRSGKWTILDSAFCTDPHWGRTESFEDELVTVYGFSREEAQKLIGE